MSNRSKILGTILVVTTLTGVAGSASAAARWPYEYPRREDVTARLVRQDCRIRDDVRDGELSRAEATRLRRAIDHSCSRD